jgi:transposase
MIQRGGEVVIQMLKNVQQGTIKPLIQATIAPGTCIYTDEYTIYNRLEQWGYTHESVCHSRGEYARDDDGDGFCEVHVNTMEGLCSNSNFGFARSLRLPIDTDLATVGLP